MGKAIALLAAGSGTTVVSVGGFYMVKNGLAGEDGVSTQPQEGSTGEGIGKQENQPTASKPTGQNAQEVAGATDPNSPSGGAIKGTADSGTVPTSQESDEDPTFQVLKEFKANNGYKCSPSNEIFPDNLNWNGSGDTTGESIPEDFLGTTTSSSPDKIKSCLIIGWEKQTYSENKWTGKFTGIGSFMNDNQGFIVVNIANTVKDDSSKLNLVGGAYLLEKKSEGEEKGEVKYKKEETTDVATTGNTFEQKLPKAKAGSGVNVGVGDDTNYWGFFKDQKDLQNICDAGDSCSEDATSTEAKEEFKGTWQNSGEKNISEWCENLNWGNSIYGGSTFDLSSKLESFKGTGSKVNTSDSES